MKVSRFSFIFCLLLLLPICFAQIEVQLSDQTTEVIDLHMTEFIDNLTIITNTSLHQTYLEVSSNTAPVAGNNVCLKENTSFYQAEIISVTSLGGNNYNITVDTALDYAFTTNGGCSLNNQNLAVDGSTTPVVFRLGPKKLLDPFDQTKAQQWDITRVMCQIYDDTAMDDGKFGGITKLTNGLTFRKVDGITKNIFNVKSNGDFALHAYDISYSSKAPAGLYGFRVRRTFAGQEKNGVTIRLDGNTSDEFQMVVNDDLTGLTEMQCVAQGHVVDTREDDFQEFKSGTMWIAAAILLGIFVFALFWASSQTKSQEVAKGRVLEKMTLYLSGLVFSVVGIGMILIMSSGAALTDIADWSLGIFVIALMVILTILFGLLLFLSQVRKEYAKEY